MSPYSFVVLLVVIVSVANAGEKVCPGYGFIRRPQSCEAKCAQEKDECPSGTKCCYRVEQPCGFQCIAPKDNEPKAGKCPLPSAEVETPLWGICDGHFCDVDSDCKGNQKCCYNPCGSPVCVAPQ
jgi:hypothetical protein